MKLKWNVIGLALILFAFVLIHERFEVVSLDIGLSWTFSKIVPYLVQFIIVVMLSASLAQVFGTNTGKKKLILIFSILTFSGIAFAVNPIYEGDFDNTYDELFALHMEDEFQEGLTMIALPGCPYCYERIETLNRINKYNSEVPIYIIMLNGDSLSMAEYSRLLRNNITVIPAQNSKQLSQLVRGSFPAFIYTSKERKTLYFWNQIGFGSGAIDWLFDKY